MEENKSLVEYKENIFTKIKNFFKNLFIKKNKFDIEESQKTIINPNNKRAFNEHISFKEDAQELEIINEVMKNNEKLYLMNMDELDNIENAIRKRQNYVDKKIAKLKTDLMMIKNKQSNNI